MGKGKEGFAIRLVGQVSGQAACATDFGQGCLNCFLSLPFSSGCPVPLMLSCLLQTFPKCHQALCRRQTSAAGAFLSKIQTPRCTTPLFDGWVPLVLLDSPRRIRGIPCGK